MLILPWQSTADPGTKKAPKAPFRLDCCSAKKRMDFTAGSRVKGLPEPSEIPITVEHTVIIPISIEDV